MGVAKGMAVGLKRAERGIVAGSIPEGTVVLWVIAADQSRRLERHRQRRCESRCGQQHQSTEDAGRTARVRAAAGSKRVTRSR